MSEPLLVVRGVSKTFAADGPAPVHAVRDVSLALAAGEVLVVQGPSGAGKTTLLAMLGGLLRPDRGEIRLAGVDVATADEAARRRLRAERIGFVFQRGVLLDYLTVLENVAVVPRALGRPAGDALRAATGLLAAVGLADRADALPAALSAGEAQRVAVARALVMQPVLVLADEPTAHLDGPTGAAVVRLLRDRTRASSAALVVVTHDPRLVSPADRVLGLEDGSIRDAMGG